MKGITVSRIGYLLARGRRRPRPSSIAVALLTGVMTLTVLSHGQTGRSLAQDTANPFGVTVTDDAPMLIEADQLLYDDTENTVTALGDVQIYYDGNTIQATKVVYNRTTSRVLAIGNVRITEPSGNIIYATEIDVTDTFSEGFIRSVRVESADNTRFAADSAERRDANTTVFNKGVYTACDACEDHPERPPLWQVKARKIRHDEKKKTVYYRDAQLQFWGVPIAYIPYFHHPDPTVKRKTGILPPRYVYADKIGFGLTVPVFVALAPNYDVTLSPYYLSRQGLLGDVEFRHRLEHGSYVIHASGIRQRNRDTFSGEPGDRLYRGGVYSQGEFFISPQWKWGWQAIASSDSAYFRDYRYTRWSETTAESHLYLTGLSDRNYFDARANYFGVLRDESQSKQPITHPLVDYDYVFAPSVLGGEAGFTFNMISLSRQSADVDIVFADPATKTRIRLEPPTFRGLAGNYTRATLDLSWRRQLIAPGGHVFTPFAYARGSAYFVDLARDQRIPIEFENTSNNYVSGMPAVGLEYRWPILMSSSYAAQVIEPMAQLVVRPNEFNVGKNPNEDAQSLVFDTTSLFDWDKFSGFDRTEGGTRLNLGLRYALQLYGAGYINALVGQSFQLAGANSFANPDLVRTGVDSGLETKRSDYVASIQAVPSPYFQIGARARFDEESWSLRRGEIQGSVNGYGVYAAANYAFFGKSLERGAPEDRSEVAGLVSLSMFDHWKVTGSARYDIGNRSFVNRTLGLSYQDECFIFGITYAQSYDRYNDIKVGQTIKARFELRTLGGADASASVDDLPFFRGLQEQEE